MTIMADEIPSKDLDTRGFIVVRGFLSPDELQVFRGDCGVDADDRSFRGAQPVDRSVAQTGPTRPVCEQFQSKFEASAAAFSAGTSTRVDMSYASIYFGTGNVNFETFHQDIQSWFTYQNHVDYLNFWIPIIKPVYEKSNLSILPLDTLRARCPAAYERTVKQGALRFFSTKKGKAKLVDASGGRSTIYDFHLDDVAFTPLVSAGDLLILRGDVFHRTQDVATNRVALSWRFVNSKGLVERAKLVRGGIGKYKTLFERRRMFQPMLDCFAAMKTPRVPWWQMKDYLDVSGEHPRAVSIPRFAVSLLKARFA